MRRFNLQNIPRSMSPAERRRNEAMRDALMDLIDPAWRERRRRFREAFNTIDYATLERRILERTS